MRLASGTVASERDASRVEGNGASGGVVGERGVGTAGSNPVEGVKAVLGLLGSLRVWQQAVLCGHDSDALFQEELGLRVGDPLGVAAGATLRKTESRQVVIRARDCGLQGAAVDQEDWAGAKEHKVSSWPPCKEEEVFTDRQAIPCRVWSHW